MPGVCMHGRRDSEPPQPCKLVQRAAQLLALRGLLNLAVDDQELASLVIPP